ncbi:hypothetical protein [Bradyrhizobium sp. USDA 10063]
MKFAASMTPAKHIKRRSLKGMARPNDGYLIGIVVEMMSAVVGSLSSSLSPALIISGYAGWWPTGLPTRLSFS